MFGLSALEKRTGEVLAKSVAGGSLSSNVVAVPGPGSTGSSDRGGDQKLLSLEVCDEKARFVLGIDRRSGRSRAR